MTSTTPCALRAPAFIAALFPAASFRAALFPAALFAAASFRAASFRAASFRAASLLAVVLGLHAAPASAQDAPAGLAAVRRVAACVHEQDTAMQRVLRLMAEAEQRAASATSAADIRADAREALVALVQRAREISEATRECVTDTQIPVAGPEVRVEHRADARLDSLARDHGTVHVVESDRALAAHVRVVSGERVDGAGSAPDRSVRDAVTTGAASLNACYESYIDRASRRPGEVTIVFTADAGGGVSDAEVDRAGGFDTEFRSCVVRAARGIRISGQRGRSVYSYRLRFQ